MKINLEIKKYEDNLVKFDAEGKDFSIDMSLAWGKDWTELNEYQQCFIIYGLKQRLSDRTGAKYKMVKGPDGKKTKALVGIGEKHALIQDVIDRSENQTYGLSRGNGGNIGKGIAVETMKNLNTLAETGALNAPVYAVLAGDDLGFAKAWSKSGIAPNTQLKAWLLKNADWDSIQEELDS